MTPLDPQVLEILADPGDQGPLLLVEEGSALYNPRLQLLYRIENGIPRLMPGSGETVSSEKHIEYTKSMENLT